MKPNKNSYRVALIFYRYENGAHNETLVFKNIPRE